MTEIVKNKYKKQETEAEHESAFVVAGRAEK